MTFGTSLNSHRGGVSAAAITTLLPFVLVGTVGHTESNLEWTVESLMALLKERQAVSVPFEEDTYSSLLTEPIMTRGLLRFVPPDKLEKIITAPISERYAVDGDRVTFESQRRGVTRTVSLDEYPALRSFVEAFRSTLTGDAVRLRKVYEITLDGSRDKWTLLLRPREVAGKSVVDHILLTGSAGRVVTIAIHSPDGDRSVMTLRPRDSR
jgi:outer membrane lipoprotein carrier protein LolA